ncbi:MAG: transglutaminase-like cysteine peptidase [Porticoccaceae bacterium]
MGNRCFSDPIPFTARLGRISAGVLFALASNLAGNTALSAPSPSDWNEPAPLEKWHGQSTEARFQRWREIIANGLDADALDQLREVNDFFNGARFVTDQEVYGVPDYWATPTEFITRDAGDCEDFAIAKYFTLKAMGVDIAKLRITYVKSLTLNQAHMVLAYYPTPDAEPLILDNLNRLIKAASQRTDLRPVYSFNTEALWLSRTRNEQIKTGDPARLEQWRKVVARLDPELR